MNFAPITQPPSMVAACVAVSRQDDLALFDMARDHGNENRASKIQY
jgi:hypothetical protein